MMLGILALAGCHHEDEASAPKPPVVKVVKAERRTLETRLPLYGVLSPLPGRDVKVGALVAGRVDQVLVAEGDHVKAGQALAHIEAAPYRNSLSAAAAQQEQARAALENAKTRLARAEKLFKDGITARQEVDDAQAAAVAAEAAYKQAQAQGGTATVTLDRATLRAPFDGVVAVLLVPAGQPVDGNGTPVIEVADTRELDLRAPVPAALAGRVVIGQQAELTVEGVGAVKGAVAAVAPLVDPATGTVLVRVRVQNAEGKLRGGMFARGVLLGPPHEGLAVPRGTLLPGDGGAADTVAVVQKDGTVAHRTIKPGVEGEAVEVLDGLSPGDRVIVAGGYALPEGTKVEIAQ